MERKKRRQRIIANLIVGLVTLIHIFPLVIVVINSLRSDDEVARSMLALPTELLFSNYVNAWIKGNYINAYASTLLISLATAIIVMVTTGLAAYGLVKANAYGKKFFDGYFIIGLSIPYFAMMVPVFYIFYKFNLVNSQIGMIILYTATNIPFSYMFIKAFLEGLPHELDEAARIDGCTEIQNFYYNVLPLAKPILTSMVLITFVNCWADAHGRAVVTDVALTQISGGNMGIEQLAVGKVQGEPCAALIALPQPEVSQVVTGDAAALLDNAARNQCGEIGVVRVCAGFGMPGVSTGLFGVKEIFRPGIVVHHLGYDTAVQLADEIGRHALNGAAHGVADQSSDETTIYLVEQLRTLHL